MAIVEGNFNNIAKAISAYADEARDDIPSVLKTGMVSSDNDINSNGENATGTIRWLNWTNPVPTDNRSPNTTEANTDVDELTAGNMAAQYVKYADAVKYGEMNFQRLLSKVDGLSYLGSKFAEAKLRRDEIKLEKTLMAVADRVWQAEKGAHDGDENNDETTDTDEAIVNKSARRGKITLVNDTEKPMIGYGMIKSDDTVQTLFEDQTSAGARFAGFDRLIDVIGEFGANESPYYYLTIDNKDYTVLRKLNMMDVQRASEGGIEFDTILGGKIRLVRTNAFKGFEPNANATNANTKVTGVSVKFLMKPGSIHYSNIAVPNPTAIQKNELAGNGSGLTTVVNRWAGIVHPKGFSWSKNNTTMFVNNDDLDEKTHWDIVNHTQNDIGICPIFCALEA